jgi:hypothetical protein
MGCAVGCGSSSGCGGTNTNTNSNTPVISCGPGTAAVNGVCQATGSGQSN